MIFKLYFSEDFKVSNLCTFYKYLYKENIKVTVIFNEVTRHIVSTNVILQKISKFLYTFYSSKFLKFLHYTLNYIIHRKNL